MSTQGHRPQCLLNYGAAARRMLLVAAAAYAVVAVLGLTYTIARIRWPNLGQSFAVTVGTIVAAPLALALL